MGNWSLSCLLTMSSFSFLFFSAFFLWLAVWRLSFVESSRLEFPANSSTTYRMTPERCFSVDIIFFIEKSVQYIMTICPPYATWNSTICKRSHKHTNTQSTKTQLMYHVSRRQPTTTHFLSSGAMSFSTCQPWRYYLSRQRNKSPFTTISDAIFGRLLDRL